MLETFFVIWSDEPFVVLGFFASLLIAGYLFAMGAKVRVRQKTRQQNAAISLNVARENLKAVVKLSDYQKRRAS